MMPCAGDRILRSAQGGGVGQCGGCPKCQPRLTITISAIRPHLWERVLKTIEQNDVGVRVIFCGPKPPESTLPVFATWIECGGLPSECWERAARATETELLAESGDDLTFAPHALDDLVRIWDEHASEKVMVSTRHVVNAGNLANQGVVPGPQHLFADVPAHYRDMTAWSTNYDHHEPHRTVIPIIPVMSTRYRAELGGHDLRFKLLGGVDLSLRAVEAGTELVFPPVGVGAHVERDEWPDAMPQGYSRACTRFWRVDMDLLQRLWPQSPEWLADGVPEMKDWPRHASPTRSEPLQPMEF